VQIFTSKSYTKGSKERNNKEKKVGELDKKDINKFVSANCTIERNLTVAQNILSPDEKKKNLFWL